ncbi:response regulator [Candidatus Gribaldobacteria bacterium]|nr:response regulator [Candidatus Gribaldobacteria bacterium]
MVKILIIEDEDTLREMYQRKFSQEGFSALSASFEEEAFKVLENCQPDLILLDILLPRGNGIEILKRLKSSPLTQKIKVVAFSNLDDPKTKQRALELGAEKYLIKTNYTPKEIIKEIKNILNL